MKNDVLEIALRSIISVGVLFTLTRIMGKKQIAQLTLFDYIVSISIGSISAELAVNRSIKITDFIISSIIYALFPIALSIISSKSYIGRKLLDGTPTILIENGNIIECNLKRTKLTINDLLEECRQRNAFDVGDIEYAILETSGKLSVLLKSQNQPITPKDMNLATKAKGLCVNLIIDGKVIAENLITANMSRESLNLEISKKCMSCSEILLAYADSSGNFFIYPKNTTVRHDLDL